MLLRRTLTDQNNDNRNVIEAQEEDFSICVSFISPVCIFLTEKVPLSFQQREMFLSLEETLFQYLSIIRIIVGELVFIQTKEVLEVTIHYKCPSRING